MNAVFQILQLEHCPFLFGLSFRFYLSLINYTNMILQMITLGGDAELELVDSLDPFSEGVVFSVRPPKKSWKNIANLSGGEKVIHKNKHLLTHFYITSLSHKSLSISFTCRHLAHSH